MGSISSGQRLLNTRNPFPRTIFLTVFCTIFFFFTLHHTSRHQSRVLQDVRPQNQVQVANINGSIVPNCFINATHLQSLQQRYGLEDQIEYARRYIRFHRKPVDRKSISKVDEPLFPEEFDSISIRDLPQSTTCMIPFDVPVPMSPYPQTADASDFLFGVSTTFGRLHDPKTSPFKEWAHWLTDGYGNSNGGGLILRLVDASREEIKQTKKTLSSMGIDVKVYHSDSSVEMAQRYLSLLPALYNDSSHKQRRWLVMCDDDTFFPSMHAVVKQLAKYDHETDLYIGTLSEDINNVQRHGSQAFGGAGVFFSISLAGQIANLYSKCSTKEKVDEANSGWGPQGDILLRKCIYENTDIRLTLLRDLYQLDIIGDASGFYEAGLKPLSLHHFKGGMWHSANPLQGAQISHACGEDCFLQRFQSNDDFIISNGYSIAYYPRGIDFNTNQLEKTFSPAPDDFGWNFDLMLGPQRKNLLETGRKVSWELKDSITHPDGVVQQSYLRRHDDWRWVDERGEKLFDVDGVLELFWVSA
ncbi:hypothetical protein B7494_g8477 [Chlorociboria aeruginascens]|nr:hypothetical protein B7494_g8477 [Chlorociboria aeruginascens]